jgi:hypothetical protein
LTHQLNAYYAYSNANIVTSSSILIYYLDENGNLATYTTSDPSMTSEQFQQKLSSYNLSTYPCLYCDATIGNCENLGNRLNKLYDHQQEFIDSTITKAKQWNWNGYTVDFEPDQSVDADQVTKFILDWGCQLSKYDKTLYVWIGGPVPYNMSMLSENYSACKMKLVTMNTYTSSYESYINTAAATIADVSNSSNIGFGLLTESFKDSHKLIDLLWMDDSTMIKIGTWSRITNTDSLSIWASVIPAQWYEGLYVYLN